MTHHNTSQDRLKILQAGGGQGHPGEEAILCTEVREGQWTKKSSTTVQCRELLDEMRVEEKCFIPTEDNTNTFRATVRVEMPKIKKVTKQKVAQLYRERAEEDADRIPFQGAMLYGTVASP